MVHNVLGPCCVPRDSTKRGRWSICLVLVLMSAEAGVLTRPQPQPERARGAVPIAMLTRATGSIHIDGRLNEPDWASARPIGPLTQREPLEGQPASERTEVRILFDST